MPVWKQAAKTLTAFSRRWVLNAPAVEVLTGIIPTAQVDKHWTDDRLDLWGIFIQQPGTATANRLGSCTLVAQEREVIVHKVEVWCDAILQTAFSVHLFTPLQTYAPTALNAALVLPWLQPVQPSEPGRLSRTIGVAGETDAGLQVVTVNGAPHTSVGPIYSVNATGPFAVPTDRPMKSAWEFQDPPLRVKPFQVLAVQSTTTIPVGRFLNVNFYYSERTDQGNVG